MNEYHYLNRFFGWLRHSVSEVEIKVKDPKLEDYLYDLKESLLNLCNYLYSKID